MATEFKRAAHGLEITMSGTLTIEDLQKVQNTIHSRGVMNRQINYLLFDFTEVTYCTITGNDVWMLSMKDRAAAHRRPDLRVAHLVSRDLLFGLCRMWEAFIDGTGLETYTFRDPDRLRRWLETEKITDL